MHSTMSRLASGFDLPQEVCSIAGCPHTHIATCMTEHGLDGSSPVIGLSFDGTGYGEDGAIWGGEFLVAYYQFVALSSGVWQNITLIRRTLSLLHLGGFQVYLHHQVPTNDGGLSLGQALIAASQLRGGYNVPRSAK